MNQGLKPSDGKIIVSGATGGVGSVSVVLLSQLGFDVVALSGKAEAEEQFLKSLGASEVQARQAFEEKARPLNKELYAGGVDVAGGNILANMLSMTKRYGKKELYLQGVGYKVQIVSLYKVLNSKNS